MRNYLDYTHIWEMGKYVNSAYTYHFLLYILKYVYGGKQFAKYTCSLCKSEGTGHYLPKIS